MIQLFKKFIYSTQHKFFEKICVWKSCFCDLKKKKKNCFCVLKKVCLQKFVCWKKVFLCVEKKCFCDSKFKNLWLEKNCDWKKIVTWKNLLLKIILKIKKKNTFSFHDTATKTYLYLQFHFGNSICVFICYFQQF